MKKFVISISIFVGVFIITFAAIYFYLSYNIRNNAEFKIDENTTCIVTGASHSACSVDDSLIEHLENFSRSGESYCYTYIKIKNLLKDNPNINTVLVEFLNNKSIKEDGDYLVRLKEYDSWLFIHIYVKPDGYLVAPLNNNNSKSILPKFYTKKEFAESAIQPHKAIRVSKSI